jgi:uncharacterized membrane protein required for colicin V production
MIGLNAIFYLFVVLFAIIGMTRGWAKELLVSFSVILALFIITLLERFVPFIRDNLVIAAGTPLFWMRTIIVVAMVFFGYQGPNIPRLASTNRFVRERLQDSLLGFFLGAINGYLVWGTIWYYLQDAGYPFPFIYPAPAGETADTIQRLLTLLPPHWLGTPTIFFAVAIAFAFVLVVFL